MLFFKLLTQTTIQSSTTTTTSTHTTLTPLDIIEILELIFSYLDDHTLRLSVLVCRQWRLLNQNRLLREVYWHGDWKSSRKKRAIHKLPGAGRLHCCLPFDGTLEQGDINKYTIRAVLGRLEAEYRKQSVQRERDTVLSGINNRGRQSTFWTWTTTTMTMPKPMAMLTPYDFTPLRELNFFIHFNHRKSLNTFPFPASLTSLSIAIRFAFYSEFDLTRILRSCPLLENMSVETYATPGVNLTWSAPFGPTATTATAANAAAAVTTTTIQLLPLRSLILSHVSLAQAHLENLLPQTPNLKELKLKAMMWVDSGKYDWTRLSTCLRTNNIILDSVHFSMQGVDMTPEEKEHFLTEMHPKSTKELTLWALDVTPQLLQTLFLPQTTLTTLELYWKTMIPYSTALAYSTLQEFTHAPRLIHQYLCESDHLVHLTTLKTVVQHEDLDLFGRAGYVDLDKGLNNNILQETTLQNMSSASSTLPSSASSSSSPPSPLMIWRCRGLRTLHIEVLCPKKRLFEHATQSRIVYGCISRVCPLLEDLQICLPQDYQHNAEGCLDLKAGLCLLGRLAYLQRLWVYSNTADVTASCKDWDVNWIVGSGRKSVFSRRNRQKEVGRWRMWRINENHIETERAQIRRWPLDNGTNNSSSKGLYAEDTVILNQLQNLGLLLDVEEMIKAMDVEGCQPMPNLERLSFLYPIMLRPEEELQRMFPTSRLEKWRGH